MYTEQDKFEAKFEEEEEYSHLNQEHRQLQDEKWTHVEQLRPTDNRET